MPCCSACKQCGSRIEFGKLRAHMLEIHNIVPPASSEKLAQLENLLNFAERLFHGDGNE
jgi:hypothetical protein